MQQTLAFHTRFAVAAIDGEGACLLSEREEIVLEGRIFAAIAGVIDGTRDADAVVDVVADFPAAEVYHALLELEEGGYVVAGAVGEALANDRDTGPFVAQTRAVSIHATAVGVIPLVRILGELTRRGCGNSSDGARVVLTDDYLRCELAHLNQQAVEGGRAWLLVKPVGELVWIGPLLGLANGPCWACLHHRLARHRPLFQFLARRGGPDAPPRLPLRTTAASLHRAVDEVLRWLVSWQESQDPTELAHRLVVIDTTTGKARSHRVTPRPQCPVCRRGGSGQAVPPPARDSDAPGRPPSGPSTAEDCLVSPVTGIVTVLEPLTAWPTSSVHVWVARPSPFADADALAELQAQRRHQSLGRGTSAAEARESALGEAIERYSGVYQGTEPRIRATGRELGERAIYPNDCMLFSDAQYDARTRRHDTSVPLRFDEGASLDWTPVTPWMQGDTGYVLSAYLYYGYPVAAETDFCRAESNGCASGRTREHAVLNGLLEVIERDAAAIWWYNRVSRPAVPLATVHDPVVESLHDAYEKQGRLFWVLDITSDLGIPTYAAVTRRFDDSPPEFLAGFGCHAAAPVALRRAVSEMHQMVVALATMIDRARLAPGLRSWLDTQLPGPAYLRPSGETAWRSPEAEQEMDNATALESCARAVRAGGFEILVADLTRPDIAVPSVKVLVPGLRPNRPRFAPGRLYDVPVAMGWRDRPCAESALNPTPFFL